MKNKAHLVLALACLVALPSLTLAAPEGGFRTATSTRQEEEQEAREERREDRQAERQTKLNETLNRRFNDLEWMFNLRIDWLGSIVNRIESRIAKLQAGGVNTTEM